MNKRISNIHQISSAYKIEFINGKENKKQGILVNVGKLEVLFNISNALDVSWVKYKGDNISFLSKNGLNSNIGEFQSKFEGGFLYTCGMDNVSSCVKDKPIHGSLHYQQAEDVYYTISDEKVEVFGKVKQTSLFGENLFLIRHFVVKDNSINVSDTVFNNSYVDASYVLLYHTNFGYPFLDESVELKIPFNKSEGLTDFAKSRIDKQLKITEPIDGGNEEVFYNYLDKGEVTITNNKLKTQCQVEFSIKDFPLLLQWKSMISGDYALGIEPSLTRFDDFKMKKLKPLKKKEYKIEYRFKSL